MAAAAGAGLRGSGDPDDRVATPVPSARLPFCCIPLSVWQVLQYERRGGVSKMAVSPLCLRCALELLFVFVPTESPSENLVMAAGGGGGSVGGDRSEDFLVEVTASQTH